MLPPATGRNSDIGVDRPETVVCGICTIGVDVVWGVVVCGICTIDVGVDWGVVVCGICTIDVGVDWGVVVCGICTIGVDVDCGSSERYNKMPTIKLI